MDTNNVYECEICFYQSTAKDFTPLTASADCAALECPKCLNNDSGSFKELQATGQSAA